MCRRHLLNALFVAGGASALLLFVMVLSPQEFGSGDPPKGFLAVRATRILASYWEVAVVSGRQPTSLADLVVHWPHLAEFGSPPVDPWGRPYLIVARQRGEVLHTEIVSCGPDGALGTDDDLRSPVSPTR